MSDPPDPHAALVKLAATNAAAAEDAEAAAAKRNRSAGASATAAGLKRSPQGQAGGLTGAAPERAATPARAAEALLSVLQLVWDRLAASEANPRSDLAQCLHEAHLQLQIPESVRLRRDRS